MKIPCIPEANFVGSQFIDFQIQLGQYLTVVLKSKKDTLYKITFVNTIQFYYKPFNIIDNVCVNAGNTLFLNEAMSRYFELPIPTHSFKEYHLLGSDDSPYLQIVAESVTFIEESQEN